MIKNSKFVEKNERNERTFFSEINNRREKEDKLWIHGRGEASVCAAYMNSKFSGNGNIRKWPIGSSCLHFVRNGSSNRTRSLFIEVALAGITKNVFFFLNFTIYCFIQDRIHVFSLFHSICFPLLVCVFVSTTYLNVFPFERELIISLLISFQCQSRVKTADRCTESKRSPRSRQQQIDLLINIQQRFDISRLNVFFALSDGENE